MGEKCTWILVFNRDGESRRQINKWLVEWEKHTILMVIKF